jgi:hypothetical protein
MSHAASRATQGDTPAAPHTCTLACTRSVGEPEHEAQARAGEGAQTLLTSPEARTRTDWRHSP